MKKELLVAMVIAIALGGIMLAMSSKDDNQGHQFGKEKEPGTNMGEPQNAESGIFIPDPHGLTDQDSGFDLYKKEVPTSVCPSGYCWAKDPWGACVECCD